MKILSYLLALHLLPCFSARGQDNLPQILNATGNYALVNNYLVDYSVGEMTAVETFILADGFFLTQGFLQPLTSGAVIGFGSDIYVNPDMSPNSDNQGHEVLTIDNISNYPDNDIEIFNRWGNIIFKMKGYNNEENAFKGKANTGLLLGDAEVPDGTYYYILRVNDPATPKQLVINGFFVIKRK